MGYQESWYYLKPQSQFNKMVRRCDALRRSGRYEDLDTRPLSVITLKIPFGNIPADSKLLWVCGERCFQRSPSTMLGEGFVNPFRRVRIIPVEAIMQWDDSRMDGIFLEAQSPTENAYIKHESFDSYAAARRDEMAVR